MLFVSVTNFVCTNNEGRYFFRVNVLSRLDDRETGVSVRRLLSHGHRHRVAHAASLHRQRMLQGAFFCFQYIAMTSNTISEKWTDSQEKCDNLLVHLTSLYNKAARYIISVAYVCLFVCLSLCNTVTFESLDIGYSFSHIRCMSRGYRSSL